MGSKVEVFRAAVDWRWRVIAANGEIVAASEGYTTKAGADEGVEAMYRATLGAQREDTSMTQPETPGFDPHQHPDNFEAIPLDDDTPLGGDPVQADDAGLDDLLPDIDRDVDPIIED